MREIRGAGYIELAYNVENPGTICESQKRSGGGRPNPSPAAPGLFLYLFLGVLGALFDLLPNLAGLFLQLLWPFSSSLLTRSLPFWTCSSTSCLTRSSTA